MVRRKNMKKYTPSVQTNNNLKNEIAEELNAIIFKLEKGKYNKNLDSSAVAGIVAQLREDYETLTNAIGNGKEDINNIYTKTKKYIEALKQKYGVEFKSGLCIELPLKEIINICPRTRRRVDAYFGLVSYLKSEYGITLKITSNKTKI